MAWIYAGFTTCWLFNLNIYHERQWPWSTALIPVCADLVWERRDLPRHLWSIFNVNHSLFLYSSYNVLMLRTYYYPAHFMEFPDISFLIYQTYVYSLQLVHFARKKNTNRKWVSWYLQNAWTLYKPHSTVTMYLLFG